MSTLQKTNFFPVSDLNLVIRRDYPLADPTLANPSNAVALVDGEWMAINATTQVVRASDVTTTGATALLGGKPIRSFPVFAEKGRSDVQGMSLAKVPLLLGGFFEADTRIFDASVTVNGGAPITYPGQPVKVATVSFSGRKFTGLVGHGDFGSGDTDPVVGYVTKLPSANGGQLRFYRV